MKIIVDQDIPFLKGILEQHADVRYLPGEAISHDSLTQADMLIIRTRTHCNEALLRNTPVKYIFTATIGTDHIDLSYCAKQGINVTSAVGCNVGGVAQYVITAIRLFALACERNIPEFTLGIVGVGHVGSKVAQYAQALGMKVLLNDPPREAMEGSGQFTDLDTLLKQSDIVSLHVPLTDSACCPTRDMINQKKIALLKPNSLFINSSRGGIIMDEAFLCTASINNNIKLVLDVWKNEPHISPETLKNTWIATPHIAGYSLEGKWNASQMALDYFSHIAGKPGIHIQNLDKLTLRVSNDPAIKLNLLPEIYDIRQDDSNLKSDPSRFEQMRNTYAFRREFGAYRLEGNFEKNDKEIYTGLDFQL